MGRRLCPLASSSKMIWVSTERVMSSPVRASMDLEFGARFDHFAEMVERHIARGLGVVEPPVRVLLDDDRSFGF